ncbi:hypothetical protein EVAR_102757_1 [Eumeta japonica]|uniref:Uncharacterized protein n=1 Tax=Eumeta variegata TaxID=151549 RepID=A0A4C1TKV3_EUMVA|nr:hypothetical protein EVAR_102757_1 [Eumeta japonica]
MINKSPVGCVLRYARNVEKNIIDWLRRRVGRGGVIECVIDRATNWMMDVRRRPPRSHLPPQRFYCVRARNMQQNTASSRVGAYKSCLESFLSLGARALRSIALRAKPAVVASRQRQVTPRGLASYVLLLPNTTTYQ